MQTNDTTRGQACQGVPEILQDRSSTGKVRPWARHKLETAVLVAAYELLAGADQDQDGQAPEGARRYLERAARVASCADWAEFTRLPDGGLRLHQAAFCRVRLCPMCQWRRSLKLAGQVRAVVAEANRWRAAETRSAEGYAWVLLTLTQRNVPGAQLAAEIDRMHKAVHNMTHCARWRAAVKGWLRATEITHNAVPGSPWYDTYHPHLHLLLCVNPSYFTDRTYISKATWIALWRRYMGLDYDPSVDVRRVRTSADCADLGGAVAEVAKYAAKPGDYLLPSDLDMTARTVQVLDRMLDGRRCSAYGGILKRCAALLKLDSIEDGDLVHVDPDTAADPVAEAVAQYVAYRWTVGIRAYTLADMRTGPTQAERWALADRTRALYEQLAPAREAVAAAEPEARQRALNAARRRMTDEMLREHGCRR